MKNVKKIDLPEEKLRRMSIDDFREYLDFYEKNEPLGSIFKETSRYQGSYTAVAIDRDHGLFRFYPGKLIFEASDLKRIQVWEDETPVAIANKHILQFFETDVPERTKAFESAIAEFETVKAAYTLLRERAKSKGEEFQEKAPSFDDDPPVKRIRLKLEMDQPYWPVRVIDKELAFDSSNPSANDYLARYKEIKQKSYSLVHDLALFINPNVKEEYISLT